MANVIYLSVTHAILHSSQPYRPQTPCYETDVTSDKGVHTLQTKCLETREKADLAWRIFNFFGSSNGNRWGRRMPSRVAEVMQFHGQNPPYISMCFRSLLLLQSRTKLALFLALSFTSHKNEISFNLFYVFPISATLPTNSSKKKITLCQRALPRLP